MKRYSNFINHFIKILYFNDGIAKKELATLLGIKVESLSGRIARYQTIEPPIFNKEKRGKQCFYHLTDHGKNYYEQDIAVREQELAKALDRREQKKEKISNILSNYDSSNYHCDERNIALLKKMDIDTIAKTFSFNEFKFLALTFGLLGYDNMFTRSALNYTVPDMELKDQWAWGNNVYEKYKKMILTNLDRKVIEQHLYTHSIEKDIFFRTYK